MHGSASDKKSDTAQMRNEVAESHFWHREHGGKQWFTPYLTGHWLTEPLHEQKQLYPQVQTFPG